MPVYKDNNKKNTWFVSCYYKDYLGHKKQKVKRGFTTKKEAQNWERDFLEHHSSQPTILFKVLVDAYLNDYKAKYKLSSYCFKNNIIRVHILPNFGETQINDITPNMVREWLNNLQAKHGSTLSTATKNGIFKGLSSLFVYACKYYGLSSNPCKMVDTLKDDTKKEKVFLTLEQYKAFRSNITDIRELVIFDLLFYAGLRHGELMALTFGDVDIDNKLLHISKTKGYAAGKYITTAPKTKSSNRVVTLPTFLIDEIKEYKEHCLDTDATASLLNIKKKSIEYKKDKYLKLAGLPRMRIHDFRHSHVALLVELGENPLLIANRLGHSDIKITLNTYAHLYPNKQKELAQKLENL